jgi:hypothetical protein
MNSVGDRSLSTLTALGFNLPGDRQAFGNLDDAVVAQRIRRVESNGSLEGAARKLLGECQNVFRREPSS